MEDGGRKKVSRSLSINIWCDVRGQKTSGGKIGLTMIIHD